MEQKKNAFLIDLFFVRAECPEASGEIVSVFSLKPEKIATDSGNSLKLY